MKKSWKSTAAILNIGDKAKTITLLWLKLIAFTGYNECRREKNAHCRATDSRAYHSWAQGLSPTYPRCFTFSIFFNFETLIKYFSSKPISRILPSKPYIKYFHCEILAVRSIAFSNCGVSFLFCIRTNIFGNIRVRKFIVFGIFFIIRLPTSLSLQKFSIYTHSLSL